MDAGGAVVGVVGSAAGVVVGRVVVASFMLAGGSSLEFNTHVQLEVLAQVLWQSSTYTLRAPQPETPLVRLSRSTMCKSFSLHFKSNAARLLKLDMEALQAN